MTIPPFVALVRIWPTAMLFFKAEEESGGGGIRTHGDPRGHAGFQDRTDQNVAVDDTGLTTDAGVRCPVCCPDSTPNDDLQRLVAAWPELPSDVRSVIMRLVQVTRSSKG